MSIKHNITYIALFIIAFFAFSAMMPGHRAEAGYDSWVRNKESGNEPTVEGVQLSPGAEAYVNQVPDPQEDKVGPIQEKISETFMELNVSIGKILKNSNVDASVTGVILGHITNSSGTSFFVFDLSDNNIYGVIGATLYVALRTLSLAFLFIIVLARLIVTLYEGDVKGLAAMKEILYGTIIVFLMIFLMPQIVDWVCTARNAIAAYLFEKIQGTNVNTPSTQQMNGAVPVLVGPVAVPVSVSMIVDISGMESVYYNMWAAHKSIFNCLIYFMAVDLLPLVFMVSYIKIAIIQTVLFAVYPAFAVLSVRDRQLSGKWAIHFFSNAFVPVLDIMLIFIPAIIIQAIDSGNLVGTMLKAVIVCVCFMSIVPVRNQILAMIGNQHGVRPGIAGAVALGAAAGSALSSIASGLKESADSNYLSNKTDSVPDEPDRTLSDIAKPLSPLEDDIARANPMSEKDDSQVELMDIPENDAQASSETSDEAAELLTSGESNAETLANAAESDNEADRLEDMISDDVRDNDEAVPISSEIDHDEAVPVSSEIDHDEAVSAPVPPTAGEPEAMNIADEQPFTADIPEENDPEDAKNPMIDRVNWDLYKDNPDISNFISNPESIKEEAEKDKKYGDTYSDPEKLIDAGVRFDNALKTGEKWKDLSVERYANLATIGSLNRKKMLLHNEKERLQKAEIDQKKAFAALDEYKKTGVLPKEYRSLENLEKEILLNNDRIEESRAASVNYPHRQWELKQAVEAAKKAETSYAQAFGGIGMHKEYKDAYDFLQDLRSASFGAHKLDPSYVEPEKKEWNNAYQQRKDKVYAYQNVKFSDQKGFLTAEERSQIERKESLKSMSHGMSHAAMAAGGLAAAAAITLMASVGGEDAMNEVARNVAPVLTGRRRL